MLDISKIGNKINITTTKIKYPIGGYAPGNYTNKCITCKDVFIGDKLARQCEPCAINTINESNTNALIKLHKLNEINELFNEFKSLTL